MSRPSRPVVRDGLPRIQDAQIPRPTWVLTSPSPDNDPELAQHRQIVERELEVGGLNRTNQNSTLAQLAQKHQDGEGELQPSPVPEDIARESEVPSEADSEQGQSDDGDDAPGSQNVPAAAWLLRRALRLEDGVVHGAS